MLISAPNPQRLSQHPAHSSRSVSVCRFIEDMSAFGPALGSREAPLPHVW